MSTFNRAKQKASAMFYKTDDQRKKLSTLEKRVKELEEKLQNNGTD